GGGTVLQLDLRDRLRTGEGGNVTRRLRRDQASNRDCAIALCVRRTAVRHQHALEYRLHRPCAAELCDRAASALAPSWLAAKGLEDRAQQLGKGIRGSWRGTREHEDAHSRLIEAGLRWKRRDRSAGGRPAGLRVGSKGAA